jgi:putative phage-type endonuclease
MRQYEFVSAPQGSDQWLELRKQGITATDMAVIMGVSPWKTRYQLFCEKAGLVEPEPVGDAAHRGLILEDAVATWWESQHEGKKLRRSNGILRVKDVPWAMCSIDRMVQGEDHIVEIKTSSSPLWRIGIPEFVQVQCQWQLFVSGFSEMTVAALLGGLVFREETIRADIGLQTEMFRKAEAFREALAKGTPPELDGRDSDVLAKVSPQETEEWIQADEGMERVAALYAERSYESRLIDQELANLSIAMKERIGSAAGMVGRGWRASWKANAPSVKTDWRAVSEESVKILNGLGAAETAEQVIARNTKEVSGVRVFRYRTDDLAD